ncbi:hypothetical protein RYX36_020192 [Vicia faba]
MTRMPGYPVADGELCNFTITDQQPSSLDACAQLSAEEKLAAEQSLSVFCKPVEFYNILHHRATESAAPLFLPRCFQYRIQARDNKRIRIAVFLSWSDEEIQNMFPFYVSLARRDPNNKDADYSTVYLLSQIVTIRGSSDVDGNRIITAEFKLCEVNKLAAEANSGSLFLLFFTTEGNSVSSSRVKESLGPLDPTSHESLGEKDCLYGKISFQSIYFAWKNSPNFRWGQPAQIKTTLDLLPCVLKYDFVNKGTTIAIQDLWNSEIVSISKSVEIRIIAEEIKAMEKSCNRRNALPSSSRSSSSRVIRLREGNVTFNYRYYNNKLQRTEGNLNGLRCHLLASHDLFKFEFSASEDCLAVNVSLNFDIWRFELVGDGVDPKLQTFFLHGKRMTQISPENACFEVVQDVDSPTLANNADPPALANNADPPALANNADPPALALEADPPALAMDEDPPVLAMDEDPPVLAIDVDSPVLAMDVDSPILATDADSPILATDADPTILATDADPPVLATDEDPPVLAMDADSPVLATVADQPVLATVTDPPVLATGADPPVLAMDADPPVLAVGADPPVLAVDADPPVVAVVADPPVLAVDADPPVVAVVADPPVLAVDADQPVLAVDADQPVLAVDADPPLLARNADPPVLAMDADPLFSESETPLGDNEFLKKIDGSSATISGDENASIVSNSNPNRVPLISKHDHGTPAGLQIGNTRKLPVEHFDPQNIARLTKRQFYHSHKAQAMSLEEVLSNYDSEDDVDDEVADIEERVKLDLHPLSKEEKQFMLMWNSFIRKQRVRVDSHIRWACKAFSVLHGSEIVKSRELTWYWTMFRIKLYKLGLIDGKIVNDCSNILEQHVKHNSNPEIPVANINSIHFSPLKNKRNKKITQK